jgi:aminopeptidase N
MQDRSVDKAMVASMLVMPTETYLAELTEVADVDAIHAAREAVRDNIGQRLSGLLLSVYKLNQSSAPYAPVADDIARRSLKNVVLAYLMQPENTDMVKLCVEQFESSDNMTDTGAAIRALVNSSAPDAVIAKEKALTEFYNRWPNDALVIDQWFNIQASCPLPDTLERVKVLMTHEAFSMTNPNRMRSVVVAFGFQNNINFHNQDGSGYQFLADRVIELNGLNPQMAARVLSPLTRWRKYDTARQALMKEQLERILGTDDLSPDVFEIASKSI